MLNALSEFKSIFANASWIMSGKLFRMIVNFFVVVFVARYLGPEQFGLINYFLSMVNIIAPITALGMIGILVRELVKYPEQKNEILGTSFVLKFFASFLGAFSLVIFAFYYESNLMLVAFTFIFSLSLLFRPFENAKLYFESIVKSKYVTLSESLTLIVFSSIKIILVVLQVDILLFIITYALEVGMTTFSYIIFLRTNNSSLKNWKFKLDLVKPLLKQSLPLIFSSMAAAIYMKVDQLMLRFLVDDAAVGVYAVAARMSEIWYFVPIAIVTSVFPSLIKLRETNIQKYQKRLQSVFDILFLLAFSLAIIVTFMSEPFINLIFGSQYSTSSIILSIHIWAGIFAFMRQGLSKWLINENFLKFSLYSHGSGALLNIALNLILIPLYSGVGAAIATILAFFASTYLVCFMTKKTRPIAIIMSKAFTAPFRIKSILSSLKS